MIEIICSEFHEFQGTFGGSTLVIQSGIIDRCEWLPGDQREIEGGRNFHKVKDKGCNHK